MSHVASMNMKFTDLAALITAAGMCGMEFREGQKTANWYGEWVNDYSESDAAYKNGIGVERYGKCDHAICAPGAKVQGEGQYDRYGIYDVMVYENEDKTYSLAWDFYNGGNGLRSYIGDNGDKLKDAYCLTVARKQAARTAKLMMSDPKRLGQKWSTAEVVEGNVTHVKAVRLA